MIHVILHVILFIVSADPSTLSIHVVVYMLQNNGRHLERLADALRALRELERLEDEHKLFSRMSAAEAKDHCLAELQFEIDACLSSVRRWRRLRSGLSHVETFCPDSYEEDVAALERWRELQSTLAEASGDELRKLRLEILSEELSKAAEDYRIRRAAFLDEKVEANQEAPAYGLFAFNDSRVY